jgi:hypothetical protein
MKPKRLLLVLSFLLVAAVLYAYLETPRQRQVEVGNSEAEAGTVAENVESSAVATIDDLEFSTEQNDNYKKPVRNLFAALYQAPKVVQLKSPQPKTVKTEPKVAQVAVKLKTEPLAIAEEQAPVTRSLTFMGHLKTAEVMTVFLSTKAGKVYIVKEGERFGESLEFSEIANNKVVISNLKSGQQMKIDMAVETEQTLPRTSYSSERPDVSEIDGVDSGGEKSHAKTSKPDDVDQDMDE